MGRSDAAARPAAGGGMSPAEEAALVRRLAAGDGEAFALVWRRHNAAMVRVATGILGNRASAEEVAQDSWIAVMRAIGDFRGDCSLAGWIFTILVNTARNRAAREGRMVSFEETDGPDGLADAFDGRGRWRRMPALWEELTPERIVAGRSVLAHVEAAIAALPPGQRAVIVLRAQVGLEAREVCEILGISEGNMRVMLHRARLAVRAALERIA
ncbi:MAG: sigma-70 family RNA polymerase sigma factor [Alphaproteobacteria bacterium]|nr:MAG: sigma-70 family RNA polymerase sigma factor [Alphaproteobacteria bacterium]